jgi:hypothetical protein
VGDHPAAEHNDRARGGENHNEHGAEDILGLIEYLHQALIGNVAWLAGPLR